MFCSPLANATLAYRSETSFPSATQCAGPPLDAFTIAAVCRNPALRNVAFNAMQLRNVGFRPKERDIRFGVLRL